MSTPPAPRKANGPKRIPASCPHSEDCVAPKMHKELMASMDELAASVGLLLEKQDLHSRQLVEVIVHLGDVAQRQTTTDQREERWLEELSAVTRSLSKLSQGGV